LLPNTKKYLSYALKSARLDINSYDSATISTIYLHISNAFIQSGFIDEAEKYISQSISYDPENLYSAYVRPYILYAHERNLDHLNERLLAVLGRDTSRLDVLQEVGKSFYYQRDFEKAYKYFSAFNDARRSLKLSIYPFENAKIGLVYHEMGLSEEADSLLNAYHEYAQQDESIYKNLSLAMYYSFYGKKEEALKYLRQFAMEDHFHFWTILFLEIDPLVDKIKQESEFNEIMEEMELKFWNYHESIHTELNEEGLL
jgi:tetratricopeptide (TPR) repeat protein